MPHASDSAAQHDAEPVILARASQDFGTTLRRRSIATPEGGRVEIDGVADDNSVLVEVFAHQGQLLSGQQRKLLMDALKLVWVRSWLSPSARVVICLSCREAASRVQWREDATRRGWAAEALRDLGVEIVVYEATAEDRSTLLAAQARQYR